MRHASALPSPVVVYFGGNAEEVSGTLADPRWPRDWAIVAINYRGYGASEGTPGEAALVADAHVIFDAISVRPDVDARRMVALGRSLGTGKAGGRASNRGSDPRLAIRQPGRAGTHSLPIATGIDAASAPFRFGCRCSESARAAACDRRGERFDHPARALTGALRCVGGAEVVGGRSLYRPQHAERARRVLGARRRIPERPTMTPNCVWDHHAGARSRPTARSLKRRAADHPSFPTTRDPTFPSPQRLRKSSGETPAASHPATVIAGRHRTEE